MRVQSADAHPAFIKAAWRQGIEIPHYCWHPGLSAPANCRMCLVEILPKPGARPLSLDILEWDAASGTYKPKQKPKLQPACYMPAAEGMEVLGDNSDHVRQARHDETQLVDPRTTGGESGRQNLRLSLSKKDIDRIHHLPASMGLRPVA